LAKLRSRLRELDVFVFELISHKLELNETNLKECDTKCIGINELDFLLEDLMHKTDHSLPSSLIAKRSPFGNRKDSRNNRLLDVFPIHDLVTRFYSKMVPHLVSHLTTIREYTEALLADSDASIASCEILEAENAKEIHTCYFYLITVLYNLFSWNQFSLPENRTILRDLLGNFSKQEQSESFAVLVRSAIDYLTELVDTAVSINVAVAIVKLMRAIDNYSKSDYNTKKIGEACKKFHSKKWYDFDGSKDRGTAFNESYEYLLTTYFSVNEEKSIDVVEEIANETILKRSADAEEIIGPSKKKKAKRKSDDFSEHYPSYSRLTHNLFYKCIFNALTGFLESKEYFLEYSQLSDNDHFQLWNRIVVMFEKMVTLLADRQQRSYYIICLKNSAAILNEILARLMPLLDRLWKTNSEECTDLLKTIQVATRFIQRICSQCKLNKDTLLMQRVPLVRKSLEKLLYRTKAMLAANGAVEVFWMGKLKNKNIKGDVIASQIVPKLEDEDEDNGDETVDGEEIEDVTEEVDLVSSAGDDLDHDGSVSVDY